MSDTLATLQSALKPKTGMRSIPFPVESYQHPSKPLNSKRLLNYAAEAAPPDSRSPFVLNPTPGLVVREQIGTGPWHAFNTNILGGFYVVSGGGLYRNTAGVTSSLGAVGTMTNPFPAGTTQTMVTIAVNAFAAVICVPPRLYYCYHGGPLTAIDVTAFPGGGAGSVTYLDGYWVATQYGTGQTFVFSALNDPASWSPGLDFASVEGMTNVLLRAVTHRGELWLLGVGGGEIWYDAGAPDVPFRRQAGGVIPYGFIARSVASIDGSLWWVTRDGAVIRSSGYQGKRVSTHAVEAITEAANPELCFGNAYLQEGHSFYCVTFPDIGRTLCYDVATDKWHDRSSSIDGAGPWRPLLLGRIGEEVYAGDADGWMYRLDRFGSTDNGVTMIRQATLPPLYVDGHRVYCARAAVEMEVGTSTVDANVTLDWSDDGGNNFTGGPRVMFSGAAGAFRQRVYTTRLGSFRERMFRVTTHGRTVLYSCECDISAPASISGANS